MVCTRKQPWNVHSFQLKPFVLATHHLFPTRAFGRSGQQQAPHYTHQKGNASRSQNPLLEWSKGHQGQQTERDDRRKKTPTLLSTSILCTLCSPAGGQGRGEPGTAAVPETSCQEEAAPSAACFLPLSAPTIRQLPPAVYFGHPASEAPPSSWGVLCP